MSLLDEFVSALSNQHQLNLDKLLGFILAKARRATVAEAGSIFFAQPVLGERGDCMLTCLSLQNDRIKLDAASFSIPIDTSSIAGYVATTGEVLEIDDLYNLPPDKPFRFNRTFDDKHGYRSTSMLAFPLKNAHNEVVGVVQLINHLEGLDKEGKPLYKPFKLQHVDDMKSLMVVLGMVAERTALVSEVARLKKLAGVK